MYSVVSASVLGYDLSRLPGGDRVSAVLRRALALGPADLPRLVPEEAPGADPAAEARLAARTSALGEARRLVRTSDALHAAVTHLADAPRRCVALGLLQRASLGHVDALVHLVRADVLDWTWRGERDLAARRPDVAAAVEVVVDAAVAAYTEGLVDAAVTDLLSTPWRRALPGLPPAAGDPGPCRERVEALLGRAARLDAGDLERLQVAADALRLGDGVARAVEWAPAMHSATWAVHLADRLRPAAAAQLRLVEALHGTVPLEVLARGCWSTLSGALQAEVVGDLLDAETYDVLAGGTLLALGLPA